jgi:hypothetical protein
MHQLNVPFCDLLRNGMRSMHESFMNLSFTEKEILIYHYFHFLKFVD